MRACSCSLDHYSRAASATGATRRSCGRSATASVSAAGPAACTPQRSRPSARRAQLSAHLLKRSLTSYSTQQQRTDPYPRAVVAVAVLTRALSTRTVVPATSAGAASPVSRASRARRTAMRLAAAAAQHARTAQQAAGVRCCRARQRSLCSSLTCSSPQGTRLATTRRRWCAAGNSMVTGQQVGGQQALQ